MKILKTKKILLIAVLFSVGLCLAGCEEGSTEPLRVYTEQTANAIIDGCENISWAILVGAIIRGMLNN